jgi:formylglycine-generating enzyme required for sulfatase activity
MGEARDAVVLPGFAIDRYPVTVAAFAEFLEAGGYAQRAFWSEEGWAWRSAERIDKPRFWGESEWAAYLAPNHPVVGVSCHEAEAYARFRGARLPTEAEWEKACRGTDGRLYPWGDAWVDDACGMRGVGPRSTVPIGSFPRGQSPFGVSDMVGCIWQWCADGFAGWGEQPLSNVSPFLDPATLGEGAKRATRGGAWNTLAWSVTCLGRNGYPPAARFSNLGFRCVKDPERPVRSETR